MKEKTAVRIELERILPKMAALNIAVYPISLIWGFDLAFLLGLIVGTLYACFSFAYLGYTIDRSVEMLEKRAQRSMLLCYGVRYFVLFIICYVGIETGYFSFIALIIPQFYARIVVSLEQLTNKRKRIRK